MRDFLVFSIMMNLRRVAACSLHFWKRQIATPPLTRTALFSTGDRDSEKAKLFQKLSCLTADYLDRISMEQGVSLTESDLADWAKRLSGDGNHERALEIYKWMGKKNMSFTPSDFENFVELLCQRRGLAFAEAYFRKLNPDFNCMDTSAKHWPAYWKILMARKNGCPNIRGRKIRPRFI